MSVRFEMRLADELVERIDGVRGPASRAAWVRAAVERALEPVSVVAVEHPMPGVGGSMPVPRAGGRPVVSQQQVWAMERQARLNRGRE